MRFVIYFVIIFFTSCTHSENNQDEIFISGKTGVDVEFLTIGKDTIEIKNGIFSDILYKEKSQYNYLKINSWKWPRIIYIESGKQINLNFENEWISSDNDKFNEFLLNKDSILIPYTARWDMTDTAFRKSWEREFPINLKRINNFFEGSAIPQSLIDELKQMEYMMRGHLTANFISFQEKRELQIDRNIYDFLDSVDMNNERLGFHVSNRNFQYYYYIDKVSNTLPDSISPFATIDTVMKYVKIPEIRKMIISNVVKSGLYSESVNHDKLFKQYEEKVGDITKDDKIIKIYEQIQKLKPGNIAPEFGNLTNINADTMTIQDFKGKNILLSAWGTWCPYCKEELPHLKNLMSKYSDKFENVAISLNRESEKWKNYIKENDWKGTHLIDSNRNSMFKKNYLIAGTNIYYLIDKNGKIISSNVKPSNKELEVLIKQLK